MCNLYNTIEDLCKDRSMTISAMCKMAGVSRASLSDLKMGRKQSLHPDTLQKISNLFGVSVDYLLGKEETKNAPFLSEERILDEYEKEFLELSRELPPEMKKSLLNLVRMYVQDKEGK